MSGAPSTRAIFALSWPIAMNAILLQTILVVDTLLVTPLGEESLAAMGLAASVAGFVSGTLFALSNGTQIVVAQAFGAASARALKSGFWSGFAVNAAAASLGIGLIALAGDELVSRIAATPAMADTAWRYLALFCLVIAGLAVSQHLTVFLYATGRTRLPFYSNLVELPVNALSSAVLVHGLLGAPALGVAGAAIGSALAVGLRALFLTACVLRLERARLSAPGWQGGAPRAALAHHLRNAMPIAGTFISMSLALNVCLLIYARLGVNQFAALTLLFPWVRIGSQMAGAWSQGTGILVGQLLGRGALGALDDLVSRSWRFALWLSLFIAAFFVGVCLLFETLYPGLETETIDVLWRLTPLLAVLPLIRTSNTICGNVLRAGGDAAVVLKIHLAAQWLFFVPATFLVVVVLELSAFWAFAVVVLDEVVKAGPFHRRMLRGNWKRRPAIDG